MKAHRKNMTSEERNQAIGMIRGGAQYSEVAKTFDRSERAIRDLYKKFNTTGSVNDRARSGRPHVLSNHAKKLLCRAVRKDPKIQYSGLAKVGQVVLPDGSLSKPPSTSTMYRTIKAAGISNREAKKRPRTAQSKTSASKSLNREVKKGKTRGMDKLASGSHDCSSS